MNLPSLRMGRGRLYCRIMLVSENISKLINQQVANEFAASIQYVAVAAYFGDEGLPELSAYFSKQSEEERMHALKFVSYIGDSGAGLAIPAFGAPKCSFASAQEAVSLALEQEIEVTNQIQGILKCAIQEDNYLTQNFLQWFLTEQLEEVSSMENLLKIIRRAGEANLFHVESHLARTGHPEDTGGA